MDYLEKLSNEEHDIYRTLNVFAVESLFFFQSNRCCDPLGHRNSGNRVEKSYLPPTRAPDTHQLQLTHFPGVPVCTKNRAEFSQ